MTKRLTQTALKACTKCGQLKPVCFGHFYRQAVTYDGYQSQCRVCDTARSKEQKRKLRAEGRLKRPPPEKSRAYNRKHREKNAGKCRASQRAAARERWQNPTYRLMANMGRRVREMIRHSQGSTRHLPYDATALRDHLERQFSKGMTWENYGSYWHVDHIIPVSSFKTEQPDSPEFLACWALTNLRPLRSFDNLSKGKSKTHLL